MKKGYQYEGLIVFYKEAEYAKIHLKKDYLFDIFVEGLRQIPVMEQRFIDEFIADIDLFSIQEIDIVCKFAENNKNLLVDSIIRCLKKDRSSISLNCNHILKNVNLVSCLKIDSGLFEKLKQSIDSVENVSKRDMLTIMNVLTQVFETLVPDNAASSVTPSNLFHCFREINNCENVEELITYIAYESKDPSMLTLLDGLYSWSYEKRLGTSDDYRNIVERIDNIKSELGWDPIPLSYIKDLYCESDLWFKCLKSSESLISSLTTNEGYITFYSQ